MNEFHKEAIETVRNLTLQVMLISAGVFGLVGGFISSSSKAFHLKAVLVLSLLAFALSVLAGYVVHGSLVSLLYAEKFNPYHPWISYAGRVQIGLFLLGGILFIVFAFRNL